MKVHAENHKTRLPNIEMNKRRPPTPTVERRDEPVGRILDLLRTWTDKGALLALSLFTVAHLVIIEGGRVASGLPPVATNHSTVQHTRDQSFLSDQTQEPTKVAAEPTETGAAADPTDNQVATNPTANDASIDLKPSADSTSRNRPKERNGTRIPSTDYLRTSPTLERGGGKFVAPFRLERGVVYTFSEENGIIRARPSPSVLSSSRNGPTDVQR